MNITNIRQNVTSNALHHLCDAYRIAIPIINGPTYNKRKTSIFCAFLKHASYKVIESLLHKS